MIECECLKKYLMGNTTQNVEKKPTGKEKKEAPSAKTPENITKANKKSEENLKKTTEKKTKKEEPKKPETKKEEPKTEWKKEKKWEVGLWTTEARSGTMRSSTTGITLENKKKTTRVSVGLTTIEEQERPGAFPKSKLVPGITFTKTF